MRRGEAQGTAYTEYLRKEQAWSAQRAKGRMRRVAEREETGNHKFRALEARRRILVFFLMSLGSHGSISSGKIAWSYSAQSLWLH